MLGKINFAALSRVLWSAVNHFLPFQTYIFSFLNALATQRFSPGVIIGCQVSLVSGLQIQIASGFVLFPNGQMVQVASQNVTLAAADPTNPRIDRIELAYSLVSNSNATTIDGATVVFDQVFTATVSVNKGTAAPSPAANALTSGNISLCVVTVGATVTILNSGNIDNTEDTNRQCSAYKFWDGVATFRFNASKSAFEAAVDGSTYKQLQFQDFAPISTTLNNNQSAAANVSSLSFNSASVIGAIISGYVSAVSTGGGAVEKVEQVSLKLVWKPTSATWVIEQDSDFDDTGIAFSVLTSGAVGQVQYTTPNIAGTSPTWKLRVTNVRTFAA